MPHMFGHVTDSTAFAAIAASTAEPPLRSTSTPASVARWSIVETIALAAWRVTTGGSMGPSIAQAGNQRLILRVLFTMSALKIEPTPKWIRGLSGDRTVVDTTSAQLVWEHEYYPYWYIPVADVHDDSLPTTTIDELPGHVKIDFADVDLDGDWDAGIADETSPEMLHPRRCFVGIAAPQPSAIKN